MPDDWLSFSYDQQYPLARKIHIMTLICHRKYHLDMFAVVAYASVVILASLSSFNTETLLYLVRTKHIALDKK